MKPEELLRILAQAARLKTTTRHCYTEAERKESVADHSWRIALMAMLMTGIEEYRDFVSFMTSESRSPVIFRHS